MDPAHAALAPLEIAPETLSEWKAGYASSGVNKGRLALPVSRDGQIVGYIGRSLKDETPLLRWHNGFTPEEYIFGEEKVAEGELTLVRDPLLVLQAYEAGVMNVVSLLTETASPIQLEHLASLMDRKKCPSLVLF